MAQNPNYASTPLVGTAVLQIGDANRLAPVAAQRIFPAPAISIASGGQVERITLAALGLCVTSVVRIYRNDGTTDHLYAEFGTSGGAASTSGALQAQTLEAVDNPNLFPIILPAAWTLTATVNDTQVANELSVNSIALNQTTAGAAQLTLNGVLATVASAAAISALATQGGAAALTLTTVPYVMANPAQVTLTSTGNISAVNFTITGRTKDGALTSEVMAGPNNNTVYSTKIYAAILSITCSAAVATNTSAGISAAAPLSLSSKIDLTSVANLSAVNFTITGTDSRGLVQSEVLAGPNANTVQSVKLYSSITTIATSGAVGTNMSVGNPPILSGYKISAEGGGY